MWTAVYGFTFFPLVSGIALSVLEGAAYAFVLVVQPGHPIPAIRWVVVMGTITVAGVMVRALVSRADRLAELERAAREDADVARAEVARWNERLEQRVEEQVAEIDRLGGLRRFLSPQIADAVLAADQVELLQPHRREIAVFFCDIRGFTAFASTAEPEEVVELLASFYERLGSLVEKYEATVGGFTGDGLMAYFNDPFPCPDPALRAIRLACDLRDHSEAVFDTWRRRGFDLAVGSGIALGYATLGVIGFEGRRDYTAVGTVVNLAARLVAEAQPGEILVDARAHAAVDGEVDVEEVGAVALKGIPRPVTPLRVLGVAE